MSGGQAAQPAFTAETPQAPHACSACDGGLDPALQRFLAWAVLLITGGYTFLDYWNYSRTFHLGGGGEWEALLAGTSYAPAQYRIGVIRAADLLARLTHAHLRHTFAAIDFVCLGISLALLLRLLARTEIFHHAARLGQWLLASLALGCFLFYLLWSFWYQKPETHATLLLLVLSAVAAQWRRAPGVLALLALAGVGATVRADSVIAFHAGFLAVCLLPKSRSLPLGRSAQSIASLLSIAAAVGIEYFIMHHIYPNAPRQVAAFQLWNNLKEWMNYVAVAAAFFPWWLTLRLAARRWSTLDGWMAGLLLGSLVHFALFCIFGIAWEVRIFLPFAMTLVPLTVTLTYATIERTAEASLRSE